MNNIDIKKEYKELYLKYKDLLNKTMLTSNEVKSKDLININNIFIKDLKEREKTLEKLRDGLIYLSDNELIELSGDPFLYSEALKILKKRKETI